MTKQLLLAGAAAMFATAASAVSQIPNDGTIENYAIIATDMSGLHLCHHGSEAWPIEVGASIAVIGEVTDVGEAPLGGVVFQEFLLVRGAVALASQLIIP